MALYRRGPLGNETAVIGFDPPDDNDPDDDTYLNNLPTIQQMLKAPLLLAYPKIQEEVWQFFFFKTELVVFSIIDLYIFIQAIGPLGRSLLHLHLCDPLYFGRECDGPQLLAFLATSCPNIETFLIEIVETDPVFQEWGQRLIYTPATIRNLGIFLYDPRISVLFHLGRRVRFYVDFWGTNFYYYNVLKGDHHPARLPHWIGGYYRATPGWTELFTAPTAQAVLKGIWAGDDAETFGNNV